MLFGGASIALTRASTGQSAAKVGSYQEIEPIKFVLDGKNSVWSSSCSCREKIPVVNGRKRPEGL